MLDVRVNKRQANEMSAAIEVKYLFDIKLSSCSSIKVGRCSSKPKRGRFGSSSSFHAAEIGKQALRNHFTSNEYPNT